MAKYCFFVGRMNPIHTGHEAVINEMIAHCGAQLSTVILGSSNAPTSMRQFFSYTERRDFIRKLYPHIRIVGIPDYPTDEAWVQALTDIVGAVSGESDLSHIRFFAGSDEDASVLADAKIPIEILDRFSGNTPVVSSTEIRDHLLHQKPLDGMLNPRILSEVEKLFHRRWEEFKKV